MGPGDEDVEPAEEPVDSEYREVKAALPVAPRPPEPRRRWFNARPPPGRIIFFDDTD